MDRRNAIKTLMLGTGSLLALPAWALGWRPEDIALLQSSFTENEQKLIAAVADSIIPSNGEIGALSVGVDKFLVRLIEECYEEDVRSNVKIQLKQLDSKSDEKYGVPFGRGSKQQRKNLLLSFSESGNENQKDFFKLMKDETIRGFKTSEEVMVNYHGYVMMPGFYDGDVDVEVK